MPKTTSRDYKKENEYKKKPEQIAARVRRNRVRRRAIAAGKAEVGDGTSIDHKVPISKGGSDNPDNLRKVSFNKNSSFSRNSDSSVKSNKPKTKKIAKKK